MKVYERVVCVPNQRHNHGGTNIAEFGPALVLLLIFIFFPLLDLLTVVFDYSVVMVLNYNQSHEAALLPSDQANDPAGLVRKGLPEQWQKGMGRFAKVAGAPDTILSYRDMPGDSTNKIVNVQTTVVCDPFMIIPIPGLKISGLNCPMTLSVNSDRPMEEPDNAPDTK